MPLISTYLIISNPTSSEPLTLELLVTRLEELVEGIEKDGVQGYVHQLLVLSQSQLRSMLIRTALSGIEAAASKESVEFQKELKALEALSERGRKAMTALVPHYQSVQLMHAVPINNHLH